MMISEACWSLILAMASAVGVISVTRNAQTTHLKKTNFYREADTWKKWNFPGYEK